MGRRKKPINRTNIPQYQVEAIARCLLPDILAFFESDLPNGSRSKRKRKKKRNKGIAKAGRHPAMVTPRLFCVYMALFLPRAEWLASAGSNTTNNPNPSPIGNKFGLYCFGALPGTRTLGPLIKSQLLYQLS